MQRNLCSKSDCPVDSVLLDALQVSEGFGKNFVASQLAVLCEVTDSFFCHFNLNKNIKQTEVINNTRQRVS